MKCQELKELNCERKKSSSQDTLSCYFTTQLLFYNLRHPKFTSSRFVCLKKFATLSNCIRDAKETLFYILATKSLSALAYGGAKKTYFAYSNINLSILSTYFTTHSISLF